MGIQALHSADGKGSVKPTAPVPELIILALQRTGAPMTEIELSKMTGVPRRTIGYNLKKMIAANRLTTARQERTSDGSGRPAWTYFLHTTSDNRPYKRGRYAAVEKERRAALRSVMANGVMNDLKKGTRTFIGDPVWGQLTVAATLMRWRAKLNEAREEYEARTRQFARTRRRRVSRATRRDLAS